MSLSAAEPTTSQMVNINESTAILSTVAGPNLKLPYQGLISMPATPPSLIEIASEDVISAQSQEIIIISDDDDDSDNDDDDDEVISKRTSSDMEYVPSEDDDSNFESELSSSDVTEPSLAVDTFAHDVITLEEDNASENEVLASLQDSAGEHRKQTQLSRVLAEQQVDFTELVTFQPSVTSVGHARKMKWVTQLWESFCDKYGKDKYPMEVDTVFGFLLFIGIYCDYAISSIENVIIPKLKEVHVKHCGEKVFKDVKSKCKEAMQLIKQQRSTELHDKVDKDSAIASDV